MVRILEGQHYLTRSGDLWVNARPTNGGYYRWELTRERDGQVHAFSTFGLYLRGHEGPNDLVTWTEDISDMQITKRVIEADGLSCAILFRGDAVAGFSCSWDPRAFAQARAAHVETQPPPPTKPVLSGETMLTVEDVARRWSVSRAYVDRYRREKSGPPYMRIGRQVRYRLSDIVAWEEKIDGRTRN